MVSKRTAQSAIINSKKEKPMKRSISVAFCLLAVLAIPIIVQAQKEMPREIKGGVLNGKAVSLPKPEYPEEAKAAKIEGTVRVEVLIDEQGTVISAEPVIEQARTVKLDDGTTKTVEPEPTNPILFDAAQKAALAAKFSPTLLSGVPIKVRGTLTYRFVADGRPGDINGGVLNSKAQSLPAPRYPEAARAVRAEGAVTVQVTIGENGEVEAATAVSGHPLLRAAAVEATKSAKFVPTFLSGNPVKVTGVVVYNFVAADGEKP